MISHLSLASFIFFSRMRGGEDPKRKTEIQKWYHFSIQEFAEHHELLLPGKNTRIQGVYCLEFFLQLCDPVVSSVYLTLGT